MKVILLIPIIICLSLAIAIDKTDGNLIAGFNTLSEEEKDALRAKGYVRKTIKMIYAMVVPLLISFISSFFIKDKEILYDIVIGSWIIFSMVVILGIIIINLSTRK